MKHRFPFHLLQRVVPYRNLDLYDADQIEVEPNVERHLWPVMRHMLKEYYAMVSSLDDQLGRIVAALDDLHLRKNTTIIYTSDHGDLVGSHSTGRYRSKSLPYQNAYRVPLIIAGADIPPGTEVDTPVGSVDLLPTILDLAGLPSATDLPGRSMKVGVDGRIGSESDVVLMGLHNWRAVHDGRYCYAVFFDADESTLLIDTERDSYDMDNLLERFELYPAGVRLHRQLCEKLREVGDLDGLERVPARYEFQ
ncbi:MAG: sulfatase-like hydrolase/transferase [Gemmatimonadetes bacterium]|nr:sulfatase-like hydrolase/transferase [Gemmatimonadota bacterium]